jgi:hypothetical protein
MNITTLNLLLDSTLDSPHKVIVKDLGGINPGFNIGVLYPDLGGYNVPFTAFLNSATDLSLVRKLAQAFLYVAQAIDPQRIQSVPRIYDFDYGDNASWVIRLDGKACSTLLNTFWADEPNWKFGHGGIAWELFTILSEMADNMQSVMELEYARI